MPVKSLTVIDAHAAQRDGATLIDVRTRAEYAEGHPAGSINVPLIDIDDDSGLRINNPDFVRVVKAGFESDARMLLICQSGNRSGRATQMLEVFGFSRVANVRGGFLAWKPAGLPVESDLPEGRTYADLLAAADARED